MDTTMKSALARQFGASIDMLARAITACPDRLWTARLWDDEQLPRAGEFWYIAFHALFWLDLYLSGAVEGFTPPPPFTLDELDPAGIIPHIPFSRDELLTYLEHGRAKCRETIDNLSGQSAERVCVFTWGEVIFAALLLYNLRHVQEHAAQLSMLLGQNTGWSPGWVTGAKKPAG